MREGQTVAGKYRIERVVGQGGMGVVVAAVHLELDERVALKFLQPHSIGDRNAVARFLKEARTAVRIKNEHVARVLDAGQLVEGSPYIVMEYLDGTDLAALLRTRKAVPVEDAVDYVVQTCEALADAHALGIVHRDLKPANLMLVKRTDGLPWIKVLDFGISKLSAEVLSGAGSPTVPETRGAMGTPQYMAPEQMLSPSDIDYRADIWALGVILYELLAGRRPFSGATLQALSIAIAHEEPAAVSKYRPDVPKELGKVVARCLAKQRSGRFQDVVRLARSLAPFAPDRSRASIERAARILSSAKPIAPLEYAASVDSLLSNFEDTMSSEPNAKGASGSPSGPSASDPPSMPQESQALGSVTSEARSIPLRRRWPLIAVIAATVVIGIAAAVHTGRRAQRRVLADAPTSSHPAGSLGGESGDRQLSVSVGVMGDDAASTQHRPFGDETRRGAPSAAAAASVTEGRAENGPEAPGAAGTVASSRVPLSPQVKGRAKSLPVTPAASASRRPRTPADISDFGY